MGTLGNNESLRNTDILSIDQLNPTLIIQLFKLADSFKKNSNQKILKNKIVALLFFEPSSRTFSSFSASIKKLGGQTIEYQNPTQTSSLVKGESFSDMIKVFSHYSDALVIRHSKAGSLAIAADASNIPVINAGDGIGEHPTQALLDLYTIHSKHKRINNLKGLIVGDLINGRTVHSLLKGLAKFSYNEIFLLSPKSLSLRESQLREYEKNGIKINLINKVNEIPKNLDFWYWTRIQQERMKEKIKISFILSNELINKYAGPKTLFMHPLPRVGEILEEVDNDPRSMYLSEQIKNGLYIRMALLSQVLG